VDGIRAWEKSHAFFFLQKQFEFKIENDLNGKKKRNFIAVDSFFSF